MFLILFVHSSYALGSTKTSSKNFKITIEKKEISSGFTIDTVDIYINSYGQSLKGFAGKVCVQTQSFTIEEIIPGDFYVNCDWEFYNDKQIISDFSAENYLQVWQFIGLSEIIADSISPSCFIPEEKQSLAKIIISRNMFSQGSDSLVPIFFLWENCSDNTIAGLTGNDLFISDVIFIYDKNQPRFQTNSFPTTLGIPESCTKPSALNSPQKGIDFVNGGVVFKNLIFEDSTSGK